MTYEELIKLDKDIGSSQDCFWYPDIVAAIIKELKVQANKKP